MRWTPGGRSGDLEDQRGGGGMGLPLGRGGLGIGGVLILLVLSFIFKQDFLSLVGGGGPSAAVPGHAVNDPAEERQVQFVSFVLDDSQRTWQELLGGKYRNAKLVLFRDAVQSACGVAGAATGPFYCPQDEKVYIDLSFYEELSRRFGAPGDFAQAYVLAHEIGHHVQKLLGIEPRVHQMMEAAPQQANALSMRMELQADCFAGVWGHATQQRNLLEAGDVEEGLAAAAAVGDDHIARMAGRATSPESFTHGTSAQRSEWFQRGFRSGSLADCNTFGQ